MGNLAWSDFLHARSSSSAHFHAPESVKRREVPAQAGGAQKEEKEEGRAGGGAYSGGAGMLPHINSASSRPLG